jgi:hypothetical protein
MNWSFEYMLEECQSGKKQEMDREDQRMNILGSHGAVQGSDRAVSIQGRRTEKPH